MAVMHLLTALTFEGYRPRYHDEFDGGGIHIVNVLCKVFPYLMLWCFTVPDDLWKRGTRSLDGPPGPAVWYSELVTVMNERGAAVDEELILDDLLNDLRS